MAAIEACRTAALGGHVARCQNCGHTEIAYNSCRNRHCTKCQAAASRAWLEARRADLLPVGYFHVVFTLPARIGDIAYTNKAVIYDALFKAAAQTLLTIAADPKHLGARIGATMVLHTWGSTLVHHPHVHAIVPGGGISLDGARWVSSRKRYLLPVPVLKALFKRLMLERLLAAHARGALKFFGDHQSLADRRAFEKFLKPCWRVKWHVYAKPPFGGPDAVLAYLARYTHRVAISNSRLLGFDGEHVRFSFKDYRKGGSARYSAMTLKTYEFIRRFLLHVLPDGFHRIRHYGLLANTQRVENLARVRAMLGDVRQAAPAPEPEEGEPKETMRGPCPCCGGLMMTIEVLARERRTWSAPTPRIDTS